MTYPEKYERLNARYNRGIRAWRQARENYINERNAAIARTVGEWKRSRIRLVEKSPHRNAVYIYGAAVAISAALGLTAFPLLALAIIPFTILATRSQSKHREQVRRWDQTFPRPSERLLDPIQPVPEWDNSNPEPQQPELHHFHDHDAELSAQDMRVLHIFDHWPDYPPQWDDLRAFARQRDNNRCQVTGCPSRLELHVHHIKPSSEGGPHRPSNLATLCAFHHGLQPSTGHERVWSTIHNQYFSLVRAHQRRNPGGDGEHWVASHLRRFALATISELQEILAYHGCLCPKCESERLSLSFDESQRYVTVACQHCGSKWEGQRALTEETGPRLAEILTVSLNEGRMQPNWETLEDRNNSMFKVRHSHRGPSETRASISVGSRASRRGLSTSIPRVVTNSVRRVRRDITLSFGRKTIMYAHAQSWITDWERRFYLDTMNKRRLSPRQKAVRQRINEKIIGRTSSCDSLIQT